jgi:hypothetical protein
LNYAFTRPNESFITTLACPIRTYQCSDDDVRRYVRNFKPNKLLDCFSVQTQICRRLLKRLSNPYLNCVKRSGTANQIALVMKWPQAESTIKMKTINLQSLEADSLRQDTAVKFQTRSLHRIFACFSSSAETHNR